MEIIRGILDDISRPASSDRTGSRLSSVSLSHSDRSCPPTPFSLIELTKDSAYIQRSRSPDDIVEDSLVGDFDSEAYHYHLLGGDKEKFELHKAFEEMTRLDGILYRVTCKEKETKRQRRELQAKLWEDLVKSKPENYTESVQEALNTKLFLALEAQRTEEKEDFLPVFPTQIPEWDLNFQHIVRLRRNASRPTGEKNPRSSMELLEEEDHQEAGEEPLGGSHGATPRGTKKQKDFVRRNTEQQHVSREGDDLTQADRERLAELLQEIDREEEDGAKGADSEGNTCTGSGLTSAGGYAPEPSEQDQLMEIDSKIQQLSVKEFVQSQNSSTNLSLSQGRGAEASWKCDWGQQPAERVLQDIKAWRGLEQRLREIQQQLDGLDQSQEMTNGLPDLTEEQLLNLLDECDDVAEGRSQNLEKWEI